MKKIAWIIIFLPFLLAGCKTQKQASTANNDDVYSHPVHHSYKAKTTSPDADLSAPQDLASTDSTTAKAPASATYDDYNDYSYSARVKRFHHPDKSKDYFDETYTNPSSYDSNASKDQDVNVYVGSGFGSCCGSSLSFGFGWGYPYNYGWDWGWYPYSYWYNPWAWYYPYYPWYYYGGYWGGLYDWYNGYPYSYINTYNGKRRTLSSSNGTHTTLPPAGRSGTAITNVQQTNARTATDVKNQRTSSVAATRTDVSKINPDQQHYRYTRPSSTRQSTRYNTNTNNINPRTQVQPREQPAPRYSRPGTGNPVTRSSQPQQYSSPAYRQPKSSQEYLNPRPQVNRNNVNPGSNNQRRYTTPSNNERRSSYPANNGYNRSYSPSTRPNNSGYSQPSRSFNNYSPSRSGGGSYSSPSRSGGGNSGGGGGGSHSSGGGSHGGRK